MRNWVFIYLVLILLPKIGNAQDPQFSQFFSNPLHLNPALTGNTPGGRLVANYRMQWAGIPGAFKTFALSYDHNVSSVNSGLGVQFIRDNAGSQDLTYTSANLFYSHSVNVSKKWVMSAGFSSAFVQKGTDYRRYTFSDQIIRNSSQTIDRFPNDQVTYLDISTGLLVYSSSFFSGVSVFHINKPNESFIGVKSEVPMKLMIHAGWDYPLEKTRSGTVIRSLTFAASYKSQNKYDQLDVGTYYNRKFLIFGIWYRGIPVLKSYEPGIANNDAVVLLLGLKRKAIQVGYSYDVTISRIWTNTFGSHEISMSYKYEPRRKPVKRPLRVFCPKF